MSRAPIPGATMTMVQAGSRTALPESCFDDPAQQGQVALALGYYRFDLNFADPACPTGGDLALEVVAPGSDYVAGYSQIIPPAALDSTRPFSVPLCPGSLDDAIPATSQRCEVQPFELQPAASIAARSAGTTYHVHLTFDDAQVPGSNQIFNNHIPLDPVLDDALAITTTTPMLNVTRGQLVPYTITARNLVECHFRTCAWRTASGRLPRSGSAQIDREGRPTIAGREALLEQPQLGPTGQPAWCSCSPSALASVRRVRQSRAGHEYFTGRALSGATATANRAGPDLRLYRRHRQGVRRRQPKRPAGSGRGRSPGRATRHHQRPGCVNRCPRPLPHHLRGGAARGPRQQLRAEAG